MSKVGTVYVREKSLKISKG